MSFCPQNVNQPSNSSLINPLNSHESPLASLQNIDIGRTPSTQVETNIHPSMTELPPQGFVEDSPKEELITGNKRQIETVTSMDSTDTYAKWRKLTLVAQSIQRFRSLKVERVKSEVNIFQNSLFILKDMLEIDNK